MKKIRQVMNVYHAFRLYERDGNKPGEMAKWRNDHPELWDIVSEVNELREIYG